MDNNSTRATLFVLFVLSFQLRLTFVDGDVGTAGYYKAPYLPTRCYGARQDQFPPGNLFAAAGDGFWDNGAACGRQYRVRCVSATNPKNCIFDKIIQVRVVDRCKTKKACRRTLVLSDTAFKAIANISLVSIVNVEFQQV